jgi:hypothetical protein
MHTRLRNLPVMKPIPPARSTYLDIKQGLDTIEEPASPLHIASDGLSHGLCDQHTPELRRSIFLRLRRSCGDVQTSLALRVYARLLPYLCYSYLTEVTC